MKNVETLDWSSCSKFEIVVVRREEEKKRENMEKI